MKCLYNPKIICDYLASAKPGEYPCSDCDNYDEEMYKEFVTIDEIKTTGAWIIDKVKSIVNNL